MNERLVSFDASSSGSCKYTANSGHVVGDKPDFVILANGDETTGAGVVWFSETPGCFMLVTAYKENSETGAASPSFTVTGVGGVQRTDGVLGFAHHFNLMRAPSWHFMAMNCRETCALTGRTMTITDETYSSPYVRDVKNFCVLRKMGERGAMPDRNGQIVLRFRGQRRHDIRKR
jgi:hypothetical protein